MNRRTKAAFPEQLAAAKEAHKSGEGFQTWGKVLGNWYDLADAAGLIQLTKEEKRPYWTKAQELAKTDLSIEIGNLLRSNRSGEARARRREYEYGGDAFRRKAVAISKKLIVFEKLIK